jgi:hypothetical protein
MEQAFADFSYIVKGAPAQTALMVAGDDAHFNLSRHRAHGFSSMDFGVLSAILARGRLATGFTYLCQARATVRLDLTVPFADVAGMASKIGAAWFAWFGRLSRPD